jgi:cytochrome P450
VDMPTRLAASPVPSVPPGEAARILANLIRDPLGVHLRLSAKYGDAVRVPVSRHRSSFLFSTPEHAEHVFALNQDNYVKAATYRPLRALIGDGLLTSEGATWRQHRRLIQPLFSRRDVLRFGPFMIDATQRLLKKWDELPSGTQLSVAHQMSALTLDIVGGALFGADLTGDAEEMARAMDAGQRVALLAALLPLPWGPRTTKAVKLLARRLGHSPEGIEGTTTRLITARRRAAVHGGPLAPAAHLGSGADDGQPGLVNGDGSAGPAETGDLLDVLLGGGLTDTEIAAEVGTFMLAGHETTANTLSWSLALLSAFPSARARLEEEVDSVLGGHVPEPADAARLPWTTAVVNEAMRLYPPAWTVERRALADDVVAGTLVPAHCEVTISTYLVHHHSAYWPDPAGFDPSRFLSSAALADRPRYAFIPFGGGRRACVGQSFAELETVLVLASLAQRYHLELTARGMPKPVANVTLRPAQGLPMRLTRRP